jgi:uncharacterized membrane protein YccC
LRVARGPKRPIYLGDPDLDRVMMMLTALAGEVSALRDRIDTHEQLALAGQVGTAAAVEAYAPTPEVTQRRADARAAMLNRVYRVLLEELELARRAEAEALEKE